MTQKRPVTDATPPKYPLYDAFSGDRRAFLTATVIGGASMVLAGCDRLFRRTQGEPMIVGKPRAISSQQPPTPPLKTPSEIEDSGADKDTVKQLNIIKEPHTVSFDNVDTDSVQPTTPASADKTAKPAKPTAGKPMPPQPPQEEPDKSHNQEKGSKYRLRGRRAPPRPKPTPKIPGGKRPPKSPEPPKAPKK